MGVLMGNAITAPPNNNYDFGYDFNYALWTEGTVLTLCNVPWNNDYRDIVKFADRTALNSYINGLSNASVNVNNVSYIKPNTPIRLDIPFNAAYKYNYLRANNPLQPISGDVDKDYYYFITDVRYIAPNTTELVLQLDVWQSFGFDVNFGQCYIERGHVGIANTNNFANYGRDYLTVPEGLNLGTEYQVIMKQNNRVMANSVPETYDANVEITNDTRFNVLAVSTVDLNTTTPGTPDAPVLHSAPGGTFSTIPSGASTYLWPDTQTFYAWLVAHKDKPWITQGIVSLTLIPRMERYIPNFYWRTDGIPNNTPSQRLPAILHKMIPNWRNHPLLASYIPDRYAMLKKLFTFPYMAVEVTAFNGSALVAKPENWADPDLSLVERLNPVPPNQRIAFTPFKYNALPGSSTDNLYQGAGDANTFEGDDNGDYIDFSVYITDMPTIAIVNNGAISYLAANAHGIAFQYSSNDWSQQRALHGNQVSYDQSGRAIQTMAQQSAIGITADTAQTGVTNSLLANRALINGVGQFAGAGEGGLAGIANAAGVTALGFVNAGVTADANNQGLAIRQQAASAGAQANIRQAGYLKDTNRSLADWSAKGDYQNNIAGINAKVQDAALIQPSVSGQSGGDTMNLLNNNTVVSVRVKMIDRANMRLIGEYWLRYGYSVRQFYTPPSSLQCMSHFTYWKMMETYINTGPLPESMKQIIRGIFEKGVTVWSNPNNIGNIDFAINQPLSGITLP